MKTLLFTVEDVAEIVRRIGLDRLMDETIAGITEACRAFDPAVYTVPARDGIEFQGDGLGLIEWMPAVQASSHATIKIVGYHPGNPGSRALPTILSVALRFDTESGHLTGMMDATFATALRTGAASLIASRILAPENSRVLGLIGCGAQAVTQLHGLTRSFDFERVLVYDKNHDVARSFLDRIEILGLELRVEIASLSAIADGSDVLCTATSVAVGEGPVCADRDLKPSLHVNAVGSDFPGKIELPRSLLKRSLVCPDFRDQAVREGECQQLDGPEIGPDLVELVKRSEHFAAYRETPTVFDSTGWALEDHVVIDILTRFGAALGCGTELQLESISSDPRNPYGFVAEAAVQGLYRRERSAPRTIFAVE